MEQDVLHFYQQFAPKVQRKLYIGYDRVWVAQWAAFYDALGIAYYYDPESADDPTRPHFHIPRIYPVAKSMAVRVIEHDGTYQDIGCIETEDGVECEDGFYICGPILDPYGRGEEAVEPGKENEFAVKFPYQPYWLAAGIMGGDFPYIWCECPKCGKMAPQYDARDQRNCDCTNDDEYYNYRYSPRLLAAFCAALTVRTVGAVLPDGRWTLG